MHRIDTPTAQTDKFGAGKNGFTRGNPQTGVPATALDDDYFDAIQEEIARVIESTGAVLNKNNRAQLLAAINTLIANGGTDFLKKTNNLSEIKDAGPAAVAQTLLNLGLPELLDTKFDKTGGTIKAISDAINIQTEWSQSGYFQISGEDGRTIHQLGKISSDNSLTLRNVAEGGTLTVSGDGARFNGRLLGFINEALNSGNGWWRDSSTGLLIQWGNTPAGSDTRQVNFPIPFKTWPHAVVHFDDGWYSGGGATWGAVNKSLTGFTGKTSVYLEGGAFIAIGF